jgi:F-type H+-transporting ATPase subunit a
MTATLAPETLFHIGSFPITNTVIDTVLVDALVLFLAFYINKNASVVPTFFQTVMELAVEQFHGLTESTAGEHTAKIFPYVVSFFLFIFIAYFSDLIPVISGITF